MVKDINDTLLREGILMNNYALCSAGEMCLCFKRVTLCNSLYSAQTRSAVYLNGEEYPFLDRGVRLADFISHNYTFRVHTSCWTGTPSSRQWIYSLCVSVHGFVRRGCICLCECIHASSGGMHYVSGVLCTHGISLCP